MWVVSIDVPWGGARFVGGACAEVQSGQIVDGTLRVDSVHADTELTEEDPVWSEDDPEISEFINNGAGPGRGIPLDQTRPHASYPTAPDARRGYLLRLAAAFYELRRRLVLENVRPDLLIVDVPLVPGRLTTSCSSSQAGAQYRPVELAFAAKVMIPGNWTGRADGRIQFARFQAGILYGCRPGYAVCSLARRAFESVAVVESFPQLVLGPLAEYATDRGLIPITSLAAHKKGNAASRNAAQGILNGQLTSFLGGSGPKWQTPALPARARSDGYDALLGLLPGIVYSGFRPYASDKAWARPVILKNLCPPHPPWPVAQGPGRPAVGCRPWIGELHTIKAGISDDGIITLDLSLWA